MKLKCTITGQIWDVDYVVASQGIGTAIFYRDYELIPDEPQSSYDPHARINTLREAINHNTTSCERITSAIKAILKRVESIESDNQRLKDRLNAIEGLGIQR